MVACAGGSHSLGPHVLVVAEMQSETRDRPALSTCAHTARGGSTPHQAPARAVHGAVWPTRWDFRFTLRVRCHVRAKWAGVPSREGLVSNYTLPPRVQPNHVTAEGRDALRCSPVPTADVHTSTAVPAEWEPRDTL